jgi:hypothetical protein
MVHGEVHSYFLTEEERQAVIEKYGPPKEPLKKGKTNWSWKNLTLSHYKHLQHRELKTDLEIRKLFNLTQQELREKKAKWGIMKR